MIHMEPYEIFSMICNTEYKTAGVSLDYKVWVDNEHEMVWLIFQQSSGKKDWSINMDFPVQVYKDQQRYFLLHRGFAKEWKASNDEIMEEYIRTCNAYPEYTPMITGWSKGGATALLAAEDFNFRTGLKADVITFGAPKICVNSGSVKTIRESCHRIVEFGQNNDIVTRIVPLYRHVNEIRVGESFSLKKLCDPWTYHSHYGDKDLYGFFS